MATYPKTATTVPNAHAARTTSIQAHLVQSVSVTMSHAEMDILISALSDAVTYFGADSNMTDGQRSVIREFIDAVEAIR